MQPCQGKNSDPNPQVHLRRGEKASPGRWLDEIFLNSSHRQVNNGKFGRFSGSSFFSRHTTSFRKYFSGSFAALDDANGRLYSGRQQSWRSLFSACANSAPPLSPDRLFRMVASELLVQDSVLRRRPSRISSSCSGVKPVYRRIFSAGSAFSSIARATVIPLSKRPACRNRRLSLRESSAHFTLLSRSERRRSRQADLSATETK